jgi:lipid II:glycine glycyltransferase (peptidoglycan interpeptide bridge formation enzyme)
MQELETLIRYLKTAVDHQNWKYLEFRPIHVHLGQVDGGTGFVHAAKHFLHVLDLRPNLDYLFNSFDKDSVQRRVRRAERADLIEKCGTSDELLKDFYALFVKTRGRHHLPATPRAWFRNLIHNQDNMTEIRLAYKDDIPISAILTLQFRNVVYYKYGCSDARFNKFGATCWLLWRAIAAAKANAATSFDLGRTEENNAGLVAFKNHWVARPSPLIYWRFPAVSALDSVNGWKFKMASRVFSWMPDSILRITGKMIYRHIG